MIRSSGLESFESPAADNLNIEGIHVASTAPKRHRYFVIIRLGAVLGVCSAGEMTKVTQAFQPSGRFWLANSQ
jgi:hypothetical protein